MIAIHTKFIGASNTKGDRVKAYTANGLSVTIPYPYDLSFEAVHFKAVKALVAKHQLDWDLTDMRFGDSADLRGYVFCFANSKVQA